MPVFIPDVVLESQKALSKKSTSPTKKGKAAAQASATLDTDGAAESATLKLSPDKLGGSATLGKSGSPATNPRRSKMGLGLKGPLASMLLS